MTLTADQRAALQANLDDARAARHEILVGRGVASVQRDGRAVSYSQTNVTALEAYIRDLETQLGLRAPRRMRGVVFR